MLKRMAHERSLVILKPDAFERRLIGKIIDRIEALDLRLLAADVVQPSDELLITHYPKSLAPTIGEKSRAAGTDVGDDATAYGELVLDWNRTYMSRGKVLAMVWEGRDAIRRIRSALGHTDPSVADPGSIRGDFGADSIAAANAERRGTENLVHASGSPEEAAHEISLWFPEID
jgi:nucleoside-diphosphate kinase